MKRTSRKPSNLSESVQRRLNAYALAASAAGVGVLALVSPADAKVMYTKVDKRIPGGYFGAYHLSLNNSKIVDFNLYWDFNGGWMKVLPSKVEQSNMVLGGGLYSESHHRKFASNAAYALGPGVQVGQSAKFQPKHSSMYRGQSSCTSRGASCIVGSWFLAEKKYLGLMFHIKGAVHYGWARISWYPKHSSCGNQVYKGGCYKVTGYAYESIAGQSIMTGQTADGVRPESGSLGALAAGVSRSHSGK